MKLNKVVAAVLVAAGTLAGSLAHAQIATSSLGVRLVITSTCAFDSGVVNLLDFGTHVRASSGTTGSTNLLVTCSFGQGYTIALGNGSNFSDSSRRMANGTAFVPYTLSDEATGTTWGTSNSVSGVGTGASQTIPVYGRVPSLNFPAGTYNDTVVVTLTY